MWITAGVVSLFFYPHDQSLDLLAKLGLTGIWGPFALYGAAGLDMLIGLALAAKVRLRLFAWLQGGLILFYTLALTWAVPQLWADPFGPLAKNIPILVAVLIMTNLEE